MQNFCIDLHNGGPIIYNDILKEYAQKNIHKYNINELIQNINRYRAELLISQQYPEYKNAWIKSNLDIAIRTVGIFSENAFSAKAINRDLNLIKNLCSSVEWLEIVTSYKDILECKKNRKKGYLLMIESLEGIVNNLEDFLCSEIKIVQPVYNYSNSIGGGCFDKADCGLTDLGRNIIHNLCKKNIIIDYSHVGEKTSFDILNENPIHNIATHTLSAELTQSPRAKSDFFLKGLKESGGFVAITLNPNFYPLSNESMEISFLKQLEHLIALLGEDCIGIGTDWDGPMPDFLVCGLADAAAQLKNNTYSLSIKNDFYNGMIDWSRIMQSIESNFGKKVAEKVCGNNALSFFERHL